MSIITKKDLSIFRGTYLECKAQPTEDMRIYLAWDTQEIYIGNSYGEKVLYGVSKSLFRRIDEKFVILDNSIAEKVDNHIRGNIDLLVEDELERIKGELFAEVENEVIAKVNEKVVTLTDNISTNSTKIQNIENSLIGLAGNLSKHVEDFDKSEESLEEYKEGLNQILSGLSAKDTEILGIIDEKEKDLLESISKVDGRVDNTNSEMGKMENRLVAKSTYESDKKTINEKIAEVETDVSAINNLIFNDKNENRITKNKESIDALQESVDTLNSSEKINSADISNLKKFVFNSDGTSIIASNTNKITTNIKNIEENSKLITDLQSQIDDIESAQEENSKLITDLQSQIDSIEESFNGVQSFGSGIKYMTGNEIRAVEDGDISYNTFETDNLPEGQAFLLILCTEASTKYGRKFLRGNLYFYSHVPINSYRFNPVSGSSVSSNLETLAASITDLSIAGWNSVFNSQTASLPIHDRTYEFSNITATINGSLDAVSSWSISYGGTEYGKSKDANSDNSIDSSNISLDEGRKISFAANSTGTHSIELSVSKKTNTATKSYSVSNGSQTYSVSFYQPCFISIIRDGVETDYYKGTTETFGSGVDYNVPCQADDIIRFYVKDQNLKFNMGDQPTDPDGSGNTEKIINDSNFKALYKYYDFNILSLGAGTNSVKITTKS